eukprot:g1147.t1
MMTAASPHHTVVLAVELSPAVLLRPDCSPLELERELVPFVLSRTVTSDTSLVQEYMRSKVRGKNRLKEMTAKLVAEAGGEGAGFQRFLRKKYGCRLDWVADVVRFLEQEEGSSSSSGSAPSTSSRRTTGATTLRVRVVFYLSSVRLETPEAFARASQKTADVEAPKDGQRDFSFEMSRFDTAGRAAAAARRSGATANAPRAEAFDSVSVLVLCPEILEDRLQALEQFSEKLGGICLHVRRRAEMQDFAPCLRMFLLHKNTSLIAERKRYYVLKQQQLKPSSPRRMQSSIAELVQDYLQVGTMGSRQGSGGNEQLIPNDVLWGYLPSAHALRVLCETSQRVPARRWARSLRWLRSKRGVRDCLFGDQGALGLEMDELIPQRDEPASSGGARRGNEGLFVRGGGGATASFLPSPYAPSPYANAANLSGEVAPLLGRDQDDMEIQESSYGPLIFNQAPETAITTIGSPVSASPLTRQKHVAPFVGGWSLRATHPPSSMLDLEVGSRLVAVNFTTATILDPRGDVGAAGQLGTGNIGRNKAEQHLYQVPEGGTNDVGGTKTVARMLKEQRPINAVFLTPGKLKQIHATFVANGGELQEQEDAEQNWLVADRVAALAEIVVADLRETWPPLLPDRAPLKRVAETMKEARERREPAGTTSRCWQEFHYAWERGKRCAKPLPFLASVKPQSGEPPSAMVGAAAATSSSKLSTTSSGDVVAAASSQAVGSTGQMPGTTSASSDSAGAGDASASSSKGNLVDLGEQNHDASSSGGTSGAALDLPNSTVSANSCKPKQLQLQAQHVSPGAIRLIVAFVGWLPFLARARRVSRAWRAALNHTGLWNWCVRFGTPIENASLRHRYWEWLGARQWNLQDSRSTEREPAIKSRDKGDNEHTVERAALLCLGFGKSPALSVQEHARAKLNAAAGFDAYTFLDRANLLLPLHFRLDTSLAECARLARQFQTMLCAHDLDLFRHFFTEGVAPELWFLMHAQTLLMDAFSSATLILRLWEIALRCRGVQHKRVRGRDEQMLEWKDHVGSLWKRSA